MLLNLIDWGNWFKTHLTAIDLKFIWLQLHVYFIFTCNISTSGYHLFLLFDLMQVTEDVIAIREKRLPVSVAWSRNDKMIEEKLSRDLLNTLGIHQDVKKNQDQGISEIKWSFS